MSFSTPFEFDDVLLLLALLPLGFGVAVLPPLLGFGVAVFLTEAVCAAFAFPLSSFSSVFALISPLCEMPLRFWNDLTASTVVSP